MSGAFELHTRAKPVIRELLWRSGRRVSELQGGYVANFNVNNQNGVIQQADVINNYGDLRQSLARIVDELREDSVEPDDGPARAASELELVMDEASSPSPRHARIRAALAAAAAILADVASAAGILGSVEAIAATLPIN